MINRKMRFERLLFLGIAFLFCVLLSVRPIPDVSDSNDTVRYVDYLHQYCSGNFSLGKENKELSYQLFYAINYPACLAESDGLFLFEVAAFLPLMFLLFSKWRSGTLLWACGLLFSVYGLELMTNAMRQSFSMLIFFGALSLIDKYRNKAILLGLLAVLLHTSALAFYPFLLWMTGVQLKRKTIKVVGFIVVLVSIISFIYFKVAILEFFIKTDELLTFYSLIYANELKASFLLFMVFPLYFIYGLRWFFEKKNISLIENRAFIYSTMLMMISFIIFPLITYRFAIFAVVMQIFLVTISERKSLKVGWFALLGLIVHLIVMVSISNHFEVLIYG